MTDGPFDTELEALETIGVSNSRIIHFFQCGGLEETWIWHNNKWVQR